jgi:amino acid adenylation domain-containing protein
MKAGAAYLPLDRAYPDERLAAVLADAAPAALLVAGADGAPAAPAGCRVIDLERWPAGPAEDPPAAAGPHDPAYLIYTSGSTGAPKGVVVEHRGLMNLVGWHLGAYAVGPGVRGAQIASAGFDAAVWEIWPYLCAGGAVHVCPEAARAEPEALAAWLAEQEIEVAFVPTPLAELLMDEPWPAGARLRVMLTGGDRLRRFANPAHPYELVNHYGPTESSVVTSAGPVGAESRPGRLPGIGRPIANVVCRVCDPAGAPLGPGCPGELWIGGAGLARGYHADPALTAARFVTDAAGERWYRSGDRVRWQADGTLAFLGRTDDQVKIRGHRIEPREVEAALVAHPAVARAVVVGRPHPEGGPLRLAAYVTLDEGGTAEEPGLREWLRGRLPEPMIPSSVTVLAALPVTANGKIDYERLPVPAPADGDGPRTAPAGPTERALARLWGQILGRDDVAAEDDFFALGGHSLLATQIVSRVREAFGCELPLRTLFERPTVAGLAAALRERAGPDEDLDRSATVLLRVMELSDEDVEALLAESGGAGGRAGA